MNTENLKNLIRESPKNQKEIAADLGLSQQRFNYYVNGQREPDVETIFSIASYFKVSIEYLMGYNYSGFWDSAYLRSIKKYCEVTQTDFRPIQQYYLDNEKVVNLHIQRGHPSPIEREELKKMLGVDVEVAVCLGYSPFNSFDEYAEFYSAHTWASPNEWKLLARLMRLPAAERAKMNSAIDSMLNAVEVSRSYAETTAEMPPAPMTREQCHAELDRQLDDEEKAGEKSSVSGQGASGSAGA